MSEKQHEESRSEQVAKAGIFAIYLDIKGLRQDESWMVSYVHGGTPESHRQDKEQTRKEVRLLSAELGEVSKEAGQGRFADMAYKLGHGEAWERIVAREEDPLQIHDSNPELYQEIAQALEQERAA